MHCSVIFLADTIEAFWANILTDIWTWIKDNPSAAIPIIIVVVVLLLIVAAAVSCIYCLVRLLSFVARVLGEQFCKGTKPPPGSDKIPIDTYYTREGYTYLIAIFILWSLVSRLVSLFVEIGFWRFWSVFMILVAGIYALLVIDSAIPFFQRIIALIKKLIFQPVLLIIRGIQRIAAPLCRKVNKSTNVSPEETERDQPPCEGGKEQP